MSSPAVVPPPAIEVYEPPAAKFPPPPEIRGKWKPEYTKDLSKYIVPGIDGQRKTDSFVRATTLAKTLDDTTNLTDWQLRGTVLGLAKHRYLLDGIDAASHGHIANLEFGDRVHLKSIANKAMRRAGCRDGSLWGDAMHGYLEAILCGAATMDQVPEELRPYFTVLFAAMRKHGLSFVNGMSERTVFIPASGLVGTLDFLCLSSDDPVMMIGDLKTSSSIDWSWVSIAIQLAQYANAQAMVSWDGTSWEPMPSVSKASAIVVSVPKDAPEPTCRIYVVDLNLGAELMDFAVRLRMLHETARRAASELSKLREGDELVAWAAGDAITIRELAA